MSSVAVQDHLFLSHAPADWALAEWLTLHLTTEGYRVWCSRFPLLGGERYPRNVRAAIAERTFRVLALVSRTSHSAPAAAAERALALDAAPARGSGFLIALTVDEECAATGQVAFPSTPLIPFHERWETGFAQLLATLRSVEAPRPLANGADVALEAREFLKSRRSWHTVL